MPGLDGVVEFLRQIVKVLGERLAIMLSFEVTKIGDGTYHADALLKFPRERAFGIQLKASRNGNTITSTQCEVEDQYGNVFRLSGKRRATVLREIFSFKKSATP